MPAFRRYWAGQTVSNTGAWFQILAQSLLVVRLTGDGFALGLVPALSQLPTLLLGGYAGVLADRHDPRRILLVAESLLGVQAAALAVLTATGRITPLALYGLVVVLGTVMALERPAAVVIPVELVPTALVPDALAKGSLVQSIARLTGPALGGLLYAAAGPAWCFACNALSFGAVVGALLSVRPHDRVPRARAARETGQLRLGLRYAWHHPALRDLLLVNALVGLVAFNFLTVITAMAQITFGADGTQVGLAHSANAVGSLGAGFVAVRLRGSWARISTLLALMGAVLVANACAPSLVAFLVLGPPMGLTVSLYIVRSQTVVHELAEPELLGRVSGLLSLGLFGTTPVGGLLAGALVELASPRVALAAGGLACLFGGLVLGVGPRRSTPHPAPDLLGPASVAAWPPSADAAERRR